MAEVLVEFTDPVVDEDGARYIVRACGAPTGGETWQGWLEFTDVDDGTTIRSERETTQPNRTDTLYWATGLTAVYLEGALNRAKHPRRAPRPPADPQPHFDEPANERRTAAPAATESVLNPFSVYRKGEALLRRQLGAMSVWHLANIVRAHGLSDLPSATLNAMAARDLIELIVATVQIRLNEPQPR